jgi:hypothetical protein
MAALCNDKPVYSPPPPPGAVFLFTHSVSCAGPGCTAVQSWHGHVFESYRSIEFKVPDALLDENINHDDDDILLDLVHDDSFLAPRAPPFAFINVAHSVVQAALVALDEYICPHLRSSSSVMHGRICSLVKWLYDQRSHRIRNLYMDLLEDSQVWPDTTLRGQCGNEDCKAAYHVVWKRENCSFVLRLVGKADRCTVTDKEWFVKVEMEIDGAQKP